MARIGAAVATRIRMTGLDWVVYFCSEFAMEGKAGRHCDGLIAVIAQVGCAIEFQTVCLGKADIGADEAACRAVLCARVEADRRAEQLRIDLVTPVDDAVDASPDIGEDGTSVTSPLYAAIAARPSPPSSGA
jgi:hypothetical protein